MGNAFLWHVSALKIPVPHPTVLGEYNQSFIWSHAEHTVAMWPMSCNDKGGAVWSC